MRGCDVPGRGAISSGERGITIAKSNMGSRVTLQSHNTGITSAEAMPSALRCTAERFARAAAERGERGGYVGALARYAAIYRDGPRGCEFERVVKSVAPVRRVLRSESNEGVVVKFTQAVPRVTGEVFAAPTNSPETGHAQSAIEARAPLPVLGATASAATDPAAELEIESVLIPMVGKRRQRSYTLCVSSQVGCAMGCDFCQTAQMGLIRSLTVEEIVGQWFAARWLVERPDDAAAIRNVVFMGMGEPMDNLDAVIAAIAVLTDSRGPAIAPGRVTVSTVGRVDGIARLAAQVRTPGWHRIGLAVSLNAPTDATRSRLMPINRATPMLRLRQELLAWPFYGQAHLCLEYVLIPGVNDSLQDADHLADYVLGEGEWRSAAGESEPLRGLVNVIPYNPRDRSPWPAPTEESVAAFMAALTARGVYVKRRRTKGRDTMAACGQLGNPELRRRPAAARQVGT